MLNIKSSYSPFDRVVELVQNLREITQIVDNGEIRFNNCEFVTPVSVLPLAALAHKRKLSVQNCGSYLSNMGFPMGTEINDLNQPIGTYIPITRSDLFNLDEVETEKKLRHLTVKYAELLHGNIISDQNFIERIGKNTSYMMISEMIDNIIEHADAENTYLFSQYWARNNTCEICLVDNGIGIYNSLINAGRAVRSDHDALIQVIDDCLSAKDEYGSQHRGTGIRNTIRLLSNRELNGYFCVISGRAGYFVSNDRNTFLDLQNISWDGTIVNMGFKKPRQKVDIYEYIR